MHSINNNNTTKVVSLIIVNIHQPGTPLKEIDTQGPRCLPEPSGNLQTEQVMFENQTFGYLNACQYTEATRHITLVNIY